MTSLVVETAAIRLRPYTTKEVTMDSISRKAVTEIEGDIKRIQSGGDREKGFVSDDKLLEKIETGLFAAGLVLLSPRIGDQALSPDDRTVALIAFSILMLMVWSKFKAQYLSRDGGTAKTQAVWFYIRAKAAQAGLLLSAAGALIEFDFFSPPQLLPNPDSFWALPLLALVLFPLAGIRQWAYDYLDKHVSDENGLSAVPVGSDAA